MSAPFPSPRQIAAARELAGLSRGDVARAVGLTEAELARLESGGEATVALEAIRAHLESEGIEFIEGPGVRLRPADSEGLRADQLNASNDD